MIVEGVFVIKIVDVIITNDKVTVELENGGRVEVSELWYKMNMPKAGGYLTQCNDGYLSYCPANAYNAMLIEGVFVIKIVEVFITLEGNRVLLENGGYSEVNREWCRVHNPKAGGYLTQCNGGYLSYCPANAYNAIMQVRNIL